MKTRFLIDSNEYKGQFDLDLTIKSGQTSQPAWRYNDGYFQELVEVEGTNCLIKIKQNHNDLDAPLEIVAESLEDMDEESIRSTVREIFSLNDDLNDLSEFLARRSSTQTNN